MNYQQAVEAGEREYSDALTRLRRIGPAEFITTGGNCAGLQVTLERGCLLVTDTDEPLPWSRNELTGWGIGFYTGESFSEGCEVFTTVPDPRVLPLLFGVRDCLQESVNTLTARLATLPATHAASATRSPGPVSPSTLTGPRPTIDPKPLPATPTPTVAEHRRR